MFFAGLGRQRQPSSRQSHKSQGGAADVAIASEVGLPAAGRAASRDGTVVVLGPSSRWRASVVVPTHNDGQNLGLLLERVLAEPSVGEVVVVASGCRDNTRAVVEEAASRAPGRIRLFVETSRTGKASAINLALEVCGFDRVVIVSGDVVPVPGSVELLLDALDDPGVGLAGGRPMPVNDDREVMGSAVSLLWELHHRLALRRPKLGEAIALRADAVAPLPRTSVDEATFQAVLEQAGWRSAYVPEAVVVNRGPATACDFIRQRRQVHAGHLWLRHAYGYTVPSMDAALVVRELCALLVADAGRARRSERVRPRRVAGTAAAVSLELWARTLAHADYLRRKELHVWNMVESAKAPSLGPHGLDAGGRRLVAFPGMAAPAPGERGDQHELPVQLHVRDLQRVRAQGGGARR